ncbi:MAG: transcription termination factor NusA [Chlamydiota bacterium]
MNKDLIAIFEYMEREKGIKREVIINAIEESLLVAAKNSLQDVLNISIHTDPKSGAIEVYSEKEIVHEVEDPSIEISLEHAQEIDPDCEVGQFIDVSVTPKNFGRIAAQKARQVITQRLRNAERDVVYEEYRHRMNEIVSGTVKKIVRGGDVVVDLGKVEAVLPIKEYPRTERYRIGDKLRGLLLLVEDSESGSADVILSRSRSEFVKQLFIQEVPEISDGVVTIKKIVREAGYRTKMATESNDPKVDPVGACVGMRGSRIKNVLQELNNEKIDIIPYSNDHMKLLEEALAPIELRKVEIDEELKKITVIVDDEDLGSVLGRRGANARLTGEILGGYQVDVQKATEYYKRKELIKAELAESEDPAFDEPLQLEGLSSFIAENLISEGYDTPRKILTAEITELEKLPGLSPELVEEVVDEIVQQRNKNFE